MRFPIFSIKNMGLRARALTICTLPILTIGLVLAVLFVTQRFKELDLTLEVQGRMITSAFAHSLYESGPEFSDQNSTYIAQRILEEDNVRSVSVYNNEGKLISRAGPQMLPLLNDTPLLPSSNVKTAISRYTAETLRVIHPIYPASSYHPLAENKTNKGWLEVEIDRSNLVIAQYKSLLLTGLLLMIALATNVFIALRFANNIGDVMKSVRKALQSMGKGNYYLQLEANAFGELKELQMALNSLNTSILEGQKELQQSVDQTTEDLRETLETIEIQNIELDLARKEALEASRIKSEFLANMSHEIRTPLNGIIGFTNLLLRSEVTTTQRDYLDTIQKSSQSLLSIINDILDFSKIEAGKLVLDKVPLNFQETVEEVLTMLAPMAYEKRLEQVSLVYSDVPTGIIGDPLRLKQILTNLVNNAIKFTDQGEVVVRVMLDDTKGDMASIKVTVTDTGIGLTEQQQRSLFNAFRQADTTTARRFGGTGLGLVISKHLVEQMRGDIGLKSELGIGSTFWFSFRAEIHSKELVLPPLTPNQDCTIAVYDSNPTVRANLRNTLKKRKVTVKEFSDVQDLIQICDSEKLSFSAIIIGINAKNAEYAEIKNLWAEIKSRVPVLIHGNPADQMYLFEHLNSRNIQLIPKPLCQKRMFDEIEKLLSIKAEKSESKQPPLLMSSGKNSHSESDKPMNVIVADDNPANLKLLQVILEGLGINVFPCDNGERAIQEFEQTPNVDLILMDIQMPVLDGVETTRRIRTMESFGKHTPIIAVTAHALASEKLNLLNSGLDDYLTKPLNENQLIHVIRKWTNWNITPAKIENQQFERQTATKTEAQQENSEPVVDMELGYKLANNKIDLAEEMLSMLYDSLLNDLKSISESLIDNDFEQLYDIVHKLHGASKYTGVPHLQKAALAMERALKKQQLKEAERLADNLIQEINRVIDWYRKNRLTAAPNSLNA